MRLRYCTKTSAFQSTLPRRERLVEQHDTKKAQDISIHAPAKGATTGGKAGDQTARISIHAPAKGATGCCRSGNHSRHHFNPRSREGSDRFKWITEEQKAISIHAPAKGATLIQVLEPCFMRDFNPRSREWSDFV